MLPVVRNWLPGMIASVTPYSLRSNIPECVAKDVWAATPVVWTINGTTGMCEASTIDGTETADTYVPGIVVKTDTAKYDLSENPGLMDALKYLDNQPVTILAI